MFQIGATIGAILIGWSMDRTTSIAGDRRRVSCRRRLHPALAWVGALSGWLAALVFAAGFCRQRGANWAQRLCPGCYPTVARATGVSWMLGMGRFGSIVGSLVGGALLGLGWSFGAILGILAIPALLAAIAIATTRPAADAAGVREAAAH